MVKKIVLKVEIPCYKCKKKIIQAVSGVEGVDKIEMDDVRSTLTVIGNADPIEVIVRVRKAVKFAEVMSIGPLPLPPPPQQKPVRPDLRPPPQQHHVRPDLPPPPQQQPVRPDAQRRPEERKPQAQEWKPEQPKALVLVPSACPVCPMCQKMVTEDPYLSCSIM